MATDHLAAAGATMVDQVFGSLFSRGVTVKVLPKPVALAGTTWAVGIYVDSQGAPSALTLFDFSLANYAGAALSIVPAATAAECIRNGVMDELLHDNLSEVLNIGSAVYNTPDGRHVRLKEMTLVKDAVKAAELSPEFKAILVRPAERLDLNLTINGYGSGSAIFLSR